jgi:RNA ligase (TIGR02306 family)
MSQWKVSKEKIEIFTHPNADALLIGKVGSYQVVVQKGLYNDGDEVIFAPEKSVLTGDIKSEFEKYLAGPDKNRVKSVRLRGEISTGIIIPKHLISGFESFEVGQDVSETLGIIKYEPPIPTQLAGKVKSSSMPFVGSHDCEHVGVYVNDLIDGERIVITSKIHGSQIIYALNLDNSDELISSKGLLKRGLTIEESNENSYWIAARNTNLKSLVEESFNDGVVQIFGEVVPIQDGFTYGFKKPHILIFDIRHNAKSIPYDLVPEVFKNLWVPIVFDGNLKLDKKEVLIYSDPEKGIHKTKIDYLLPSWIQEKAETKERVSGSELHIEEGLVIRPYIDRNAKDGTPLRLKVISKLYRETGEEIN